MALSNSASLPPFLAIGTMHVGMRHDIGWITYSRMRNHLTAEAKGRYGYGFGKVAFYDLDSMKGEA